MKKIYNPDNMLSCPSFSVCKINGNTGYISGQVSMDINTGELINGDIALETKNTLDNIKSIVEGIGSTLDDILMVNIFMEDMNKFDEMNAVYKEYFQDCAMPARVTVGVNDLMGVKIEIACTVAVNQ